MISGAFAMPPLLAWVEALFKSRDVWARTICGLSSPVDRGSRYTSIDNQEFTDDGVMASVGSIGDAYGNGELRAAPGAGSICSLLLRAEAVAQMAVARATGRHAPVGPTRRHLAPFEWRPSGQASPWLKSKTGTPPLFRTP